MIPVTGFTDTVPPQALELELITVSPEGRESVSPTPLNVIVFAAGLETEKVSVLASPVVISAGVNVALTAGGSMTARLAPAGAPLMPMNTPPPSSKDAVRFAVALLLGPAVKPVTFTVTEQEALGARVKSKIVTLDAPAPATTEAPFSWP